MVHIGTPFLLPNDIWLYRYITFLLIHLSLRGHLGCFCFLLMNNAARNICVQVFVRAHVLISLGCIPRRGAAGAHGNPASDILRGCQTVFRSDCTVLRFHQQCMRVPTSLLFESYRIRMTSLYNILTSWNFWWKKTRKKWKKKKNVHFRW